jgi:hypothetical protein
MSKDWLNTVDMKASPGGHDSKAAKVEGWRRVVH